MYKRYDCIAHLLAPVHALVNVENLAELTKLTKLILSSSSRGLIPGLSGPSAVSRTLQVRNFGSRSMPEMREFSCCCVPVC